MSMRSYGVDERGLVLTIGQFIELLNKSGKELLEKGYIDDLEDLKDIDDSNVNDLVWDMGITYYGEIEGEILSLDGCETREYLDCEGVIIFYLKKDSLYASYKDIEEIYSELYNTLKDYGLNADMEFIKNNVGILNGTYVA